MYNEKLPVNFYIHFVQNFLHEKILFYILFSRRKTFYQQFHRVQSDINLLLWKILKYENKASKLKKKILFSIISIRLSTTKNRLFYPCITLVIDYVIPITRNNAIQLATGYCLIAAQCHVWCPRHSYVKILNHLMAW